MWSVGEEKGAVFMGLQIRRIPSIKFNTITTLIAVFALIAQPMYGLVAAQVANAVAPNTRHVSATGNDSGSDCLNPGVKCKTIQHAIDVADPGDTVRVIGGNYVENIVINKKINLVGADVAGLGVPTITRGTNSSYAVSLPMASSGSTLKGFNLKGTSGTPIVKVTGIVSDVTISDNTFNQDLAGSHSVYAGTGTLSNIVFSNNTFYVGSGVRAVYGEKGSGGLSNIQFVDNVFSGNTDKLVVGLEATGTTFTGNNLSAVTTTYTKTLELGESPAVFSGNTITSGNAVEVVKSGITSGVFSDIYEAVKYAQAGDTIKLNSDITLNSESLKLMKQGLVLDGNGKKVTGNFPAVNKTVNSAAIYVGGDDVTVKNLTVVGPSDVTNKMHNIQVYAAQNTKLDDVTVKNATKYGLLVNLSTATITNLTTDMNAWGGVNVQGSGSSGANGPATARLTVLGTSVHNEAADKAHIFIDEREDSVVVNDTAGQYLRFWEGAGYMYLQDTAKPTVVTTINKAYNPTDVKVVAHDDQRLSRIDVSLRRDNGTDVQKWWGQAITHNDRKDFTLDIGADITAMNLPDGQYTVRATVSDGLGKTTNSENVNFTIDTVKPAAPKSLSVRATDSNAYIPNGGTTNIPKVTASWANGASEPVTYIYKFWKADNTGSVWTVDRKWENPTSATSFQGVYNEGQGLNNFCVVAVDAAGNESDCSATYSVDFDTTAPVASIAASTPTISSVTNGATVKSPLAIAGTSTELSRHWFEVKAPNGTLYTWQSNDIAMSADLDIMAAKFAGSSIPTIGGKLVDGAYTVRYVETDRAGNRNDHFGTPQFASTTFSFTIDNTAPIVTVTSSVRNSDGTYTITGMTQEGVMPAVTVNDADVDDITMSGDSWTATTGVLAYGSYVVKASARDSAGNSSEVAMRTFSYEDTTPLQKEPKFTPTIQADPVQTLPVLNTIFNSQQRTFFGTAVGDLVADNAAQTPAEAPSVLGAKDAKSTLASTASPIAASEDGWKVFGLAWYWWIAALAAIASIWWFIAAWRRRQDEDQPSFLG